MYYTPTFFLLFHLYTSFSFKCSVLTYISTYSIFPYTILSSFNVYAVCIWKVRLLLQMMQNLRLIPLLSYLLLIGHHLGNTEGSVFIFGILNLEYWNIFPFFFMQIMTSTVMDGGRSVLWLQLFFWNSFKFYILLLRDMKEILNI